MLTLIAHRGTPREHPENTFDSLRHAQTLGADAVEFDVRTTRDGVPVLLHDTDLARIWGRPDVLAETDHADVAEVLPALADVAADIAITLIVDCKGAGTVARAVPVLRAAGALPRCVFIGQPDVLEEVRAELPDARLALSWSGASTPPPELLARLRPEIMNVRWADLAESSLDTYRAAGLTTWWTYTIDDVDALRRALELGITGIITNDLPLIGAAAASAAGR